MSSGLPFDQNDTHVWFTTTHFTAFVGGLLADLEIWDTADTDKENIPAFIDDLVNFTANYTDSSTGAPGAPWASLNACGRESVKSAQETRPARIM